MSKIKDNLVKIAEIHGCDTDSLVENIRTLLQYSTYEDILEFVHE